MDKDEKVNVDIPDKVPELSLVLPCYNEADIIRWTATRLIKAFRDQQVDFELVLVDNGSQDDTGKIIQEMVDEGLPVAKVTVDINQGYGNGVLSGLKAAKAEMVGFMVADGQVDESDVVDLCGIAMQSKTPKVFKIRRRFRLDGLSRKIFSTFYNLAVISLFGDLGTLDINANPKILPRKTLEQMNLQSKDWFIDAEMMIKTKKMGIGVFELNALAKMRLEGRSNVHASTIWEFIVNLIKYRFFHPFEITEYRDDDSWKISPEEKALHSGTFTDRNL